MTFKVFELSKQINKSNASFFEYELAEEKDTFSYSDALKKLFDGIKVINTDQLEFWEKYGTSEDDLMFTNSSESSSGSADGREGHDTIIGGNGRDILQGGDGMDRIYGNGGEDHIESGNSSDFASGGEGNDSLYGGLGHDTLRGGKGSDYIYGDIGNDIIEGGNDTDVDFLYGGGDDDTIIAYANIKDVQPGWLESAVSDHLAGDEGADTFIIRHDTSTLNADNQILQGVVIRDFVDVGDTVVFENLQGELVLEAGSDPWGNYVEVFDSADAERSTLTILYTNADGYREENIVGDATVHLGVNGNSIGVTRVEFPSPGIEF